MHSSFQLQVYAVSPLGARRRKGKSPATSLTSPGGRTDQQTPFQAHVTSGESSTQPSPSHFMNCTALVLQKSQDQQHCSKKPQDQSLEGDRVRSSFLIKTKTSALLVTMIFKREVEEVIKAKRFSNAWPDRQDFPCSSPAFPAGPSRGWQKKFNQLELSTEGTTSATSPQLQLQVSP